MRYKVVLYNAGGAADADLSGNFSFYTRQQAYACCISWVEQYGNNTARMWDGYNWTFVNP